MSGSQQDRSVFVVHGRNENARDAMFAFLHAIGLDPIDWSDAVHETGEGSPYVGKVLDAAFRRARAIVVLFTPDDEVRLRDQWQREGDPPHETDLTGQARPNVLFEAGMAIGRNEKGTVLVELGELRPFSDIGGRHVLRLDDSLEKRRQLARRLETAGCAVNLDGENWCRAGRFDSAIAAMEEPPRGPPRPLPALTESAADMLRRAGDSQPKKIHSLLDAHGNWRITTGRYKFKTGDPRAAAKSRGALDELLSANMVGTRQENAIEWVHTITERGFQWIDDDARRRQQASLPSSLSEEAVELLQAAVEAGGDIVRFSSANGPVIKVRGRVFDTNDPRSEAKWDGAVIELAEKRLIRPRSDSVLSVTREGYAVADSDQGPHEGARSNTPGSETGNDT